LKRILLAEDEEILARTLKAYLEEFDFTVDWVGDCASALEALKTQEFYGLVLDQSLPDAQGIQVIPGLFGLGYKPRVIVHSGAITPREEKEYKDAAPPGLAITFFHKPVFELMDFVRFFNQ
jgi:DNA-binding response OmpR family regulator